MKFLTPHRDRNDPSDPTGRTRQLTAPLVWQALDGQQFSVPAGYDTDYASVPRLLWWLLPPTGKYTCAAIVHDWLYWEQPVRRVDADRYFLEAMADCGTSWWERTLIYWGVRVGGWAPWAMYRQQRGN